MESKDVLELITALVDNEIETKEKAKELKLLIESSEEFNFEYQIQNYIKSMIKTRVQKVETPEHLKKQILNDIFKESQPAAEKQKKTWFKWVLKPAFAFSIFISVFFLVLLFSRNSTSENIAREQNGETNMFSQALQNFQSIVKGNLSAQLQSNSIEELKSYFKNNGVNYEANVPLAKNWHLAGASISEIKGKKLAHNIYRNSSGKLAYLYQANEDLLTNQKILNLSPDLLKLVNDGKSFRYNDNDKSVMVWKCKKNICILVSNDRLDKLEQFAASR